MIEFHYESDFKLSKEDKYTEWLENIAISEKTSIGALTYIFCNDDKLLGINKEFLGHDDLTDIISFDYGDQNTISGDIFISKDRVWDNAGKFNVSKELEMLRVMAHGLLHLIGYNDKSSQEKRMMKEKEDEKIKMFHVEQ